MSDARPIDSRRQLTRDVWIAIGREIFPGMKTQQWKFRCVSCGHVQTAEGLMQHCKLTPERAMDAVYFSCEGRFDGHVGGCDWTLGGFFKIHRLEVLDPESLVFRPVFEFEDGRASALVEAARLAPREHPASEIIDWTTYVWPDWIPELTRVAIRRYSYRGPKDWLATAARNDPPPLGTRATFRPDGGGVVEGRFVFIANDSGHVVNDDGVATLVRL